MKKITFFFCVIILFCQCKPKKNLPVTTEQTLFESGIVGEFMYFADAPVFRLCNEQKIYPVAMEKAYIDVEKMYLQKVEGGTWIYVVVQGDFEEKINEEGQKTKMFVIKKLWTMDENKGCNH